MRFYWRIYHVCILVLESSKLRLIQRNWLKSRLQNKDEKSLEINKIWGKGELVFQFHGSCAREIFQSGFLQETIK